jgi:DNA-directed RNA polymerase specialized sigma24 family protein
VRGDSALAAPASESGTAGFDGLAGDSLAPDLAALLAEEFQSLLERLDDAADPDLRRIALWKMEGQSSADIAEQLGCSVPTVRRRLRLIRTLFKNP